MSLSAHKIQTYLSEAEDDYTCGHISMGRSFALEMGSLIPQTDQRLGKLTQICRCVLRVF